MTNIIKGCSILLNMNNKAKQNIKIIVVKSIPLYHCWPSEQPSLPRPGKQPTLSKEELHQAGLRPRRTLFTFPRSKPCLHLTLTSKIISNDIYLGLQTLMLNVLKTSRLSQHCFDPQFHGRPLGNHDQSQRPGNHNIPLKFGCSVFLSVPDSKSVSICRPFCWSFPPLSGLKQIPPWKPVLCMFTKCVSMFLREATKKTVNFRT